ncbi:membrane dipeptidase [Oscillibacter sp. PC13]|uniref:dipeptidase n=1 Tax=Oscillibacter sp. PC13 TaxID=1855299 RepID=UPI0008EB574C|nr:membrane dipeptidase [Oscillibacter sp. PC13]SFP73924.1 membrane dipeptidase [Oscillibacter sp. PC13]
MVFDAHSDLLYDVARRRLAGESRVLERRHLDRLQKGGLEGLVLSVWTSAAVGETFWKDTDWCAPEAFLGRTHQMLSYARDDLAECERMRLVHSWTEAAAARGEGKIYAFLGIEGMAAIGTELRGIDWYYDAGARTGMLTWNEENAFATGAGGDAYSGLSELGRQAVRRMQKKRMLVDVSHLNDGSFWDVMKLTAAPVIASHSNCRRLCDVRRNLSDDQLRAIRDVDGVVGLNAYHGFVHEDHRQQTARTLARHAAHMADVIGVEHVGCGFDFCHFMGPGNEGAEGLEDAAQIKNLFYWLEQLGMTVEEREKIAHGNFQRVLEDVLG